MSLRKNHPILSIVNGVLVDLPTPPNLTYFWGFGSLLGVTLALQIISGLLLTTRYNRSAEGSFDSVVDIFQETNFGWFFRLLHSTTARFFFLFLYTHMARGLYYSSYRRPEVWNLGVVIYLILMATAFLGYVLPWGQISYWGATVITNLLSAIPFVGSKLVVWVWGGYAVGGATLTRFYTLHFLIPFLVLALVGLHIFFLHFYGSSNPMGISTKSFRVFFHHYYRWKDSVGFIIYFFSLLLVTFLFGYNLIDAENFILANSLVTPTHIQPEWYFLFAYAILRSIPNKLGGVVARLLSILFLFLFPFKHITFSSHTGLRVPSRLVFWLFVVNFIVLTWLGIIPAEYPFTFVSLVCTLFYFILAGLILSF